MAVLLPAPSGPTSPNISPRAISRSRLSTARFAPKARDRDVGCREIIGSQVGRADPSDLLVVMELKIACNMGHPVSHEVDLAVRVRVTASTHEGAHGDLDPEFLLHLPSQTRLQGLTLLEFAARELPLVGHSVPPLPPGDENPPVSFQYGCRDCYPLGVRSLRNHFRLIPAAKAKNLELAGVL